jgi:hypothetical protein
MKYILIIWVCSFIEGNGCMPPMQSPQVYDSWYECSIEAHRESAKLLQKMGYAEVNRYQVGVKYSCKESRTY